MAEGQSGLCSLLALAAMGAGAALPLSAVALGPPAVGGDQCLQRDEESRPACVYQLYSSLDHAFTVKTLPTQALPKTMGIALKTTKCFRVFLEVLSLFDCFPSFYDFNSHSEQFFSLFFASQKARNVLSFQK